MTGPVIDLGELRHTPDPDPLPRPPRANGRMPRCALVLLLVLATLASAGLPPRRDVVTLPAQLAAETLLDGDLFVVLDPSPARPTQRRLTVFRLPGGGPVWQTRVPVEGRSWGITSAAGTLLVTVYESTMPGQGTVSVAFDRETGAYRWQQPGSPAELADGNLLLESSSGGNDPIALRAVDPCCGTVRWQSSVTADVHLRHTGRGADRVVLFRVNGPVEVRDAITGTVLARADVRPPGGWPGAVQVVNDLLLTTAGTPATITAYGLDRLDRRWSVPADQAEFASDCGPLLCLHVRGVGLRAVDPATGQERWRGDGWASVFPYGGRLMASAATSSGPALEQLVVLDPLTGRELAELGRWELAQSGFGSPLVGVRRNPEGGLLVARLDARSGEARMLDVLPDVAGNCQASVGLLLCQRVDGSYRLFRMPD
ncbi:PQQ-like beta-propeller repeat protein [Micromonospora sp. RHAY321]|uniref:outer membrane protein assembly factor BamB family protein n=1 Tax=Micromonospora sp. RHAY321 TaxID=2944807 RepID=UPI00207C174E|nr:PQQ-binding-like beta-propeller repeat protein [Micromonospora sp. RHAY321]MCO1595906.1 PQQ-like beta-propeller repeat protein [Micromonospora sp. RHAY321]